MCVRERQRNQVELNFIHSGIHTIFLHRDQNCPIRVAFWDNIGNCRLMSNVDNEHDFFSTIVHLLVNLNI